MKPGRAIAAFVCFVGVLVAYAFGVLDGTGSGLRYAACMRDETTQAKDCNKHLTWFLQ